MRIVVALGGNALLPRGEMPDATVEHSAVVSAVHAIAATTADHELIITYGNGPQVGVLASLLAEDNRPGPYPLDVVGAQTQGMLGYWLAQSLQSVLPERKIASILNQVLVDPADSAFENPTKFVGRGYDDDEAARLVARYNWRMKRDGSLWRRVVPSPYPLQVVEMAVLRQLVESGVIVVCGGGGGVPVVATAEGGLRGVQAVVDKDLTSALIAEALEAELLLILTDVPHVYRDWGDQSSAIEHATPAEMLSLPLPSGSMGPKARAASDFVQRTGRAAAIGNVEKIAEILEGTAGTWILPGPGAKSRV